MKLSARQLNTMNNVRLRYSQLCNKRTLHSLEKKGLIQWHTLNGWILTEQGANIRKEMKL